ncbi:MAG: FixH family protein [Marinobacterium sp.]|nr:FixH family protein [Marinobacterium sp.]
MSKHTNEAIAPWYRQPWLWFILTPLIAVFIYGTAYLILSIVTHDGIVKEDHYKIARGYHRDSSKLEAAQKLGLSGELTVDNLTGDLVLKLSSSSDKSWDSLTLELVHPTHQQYDQNITLKPLASSRIYRGNLPAPIKGKRYITLSSGNAEDIWQLRAEISPPYEQAKFILDAGEKK